MIGSLVDLVGAEFEGQVARLRATVDAYVEAHKQALKSEIRHEVREAGISASILLAATLCAFGVLIIGLIALHLWVAVTYGPFYGLGAVGGVLLVCGLIFLTVAMTRAHNPYRASPVTPALPVVPVTPVAKPTVYATQFVPPLGADASLIDVMLHRVSNRAAGAADEAIDAATDLVRKGPATTLVATLLVTAALGWTIGRRAKF
ncbi:MAG: phage holin family protein [Xanthobacteraceae bacterium]